MVLAGVAVSIVGGIRYAATNRALRQGSSSALSPLLAYLGAALIAVSWNLLFWGEAAAALGYAIIAAFALPRHGVAKPAASDDSPPKVKRQLGGFGVLLSDRRYGLYLFAEFINAVVYWQYVSVLPLTMRAAGLITAWYAALVALNGGIVICFELLMTKVTQRWPPRPVRRLTGRGSAPPPRAGDRPGW